MNILSRIFKWYFSRNALPYWSVILLDCLSILLSGLFVYALNNGASSTLGVLSRLLFTLMIGLIPFLIGFRIFHTYSGIIRYSSFADLQRIGGAICVGAFLLILLQEFVGIPSTLVYIRKRDIIFASLLALCLMWVLRVFVKYLYVATYRMTHAERAMIYGIKQGGISLAKSIQNQDPAQYVLAGFVSDVVKEQNRFLMGVKVYPFDENLISVMHHVKATILFVSPLRGDAVREHPDMVTRLAEAGIKIYVVPNAQLWDGKSNLNHTMLRQVEIEDLLPREKIEIDMKEVEESLKGQKVLITGAAGSIGSEIVRQIAALELDELILIDQAETPLHDIRLMMAKEWPQIKAFTLVADIVNATRMEEIFAEHRPAFVFHAAAYKHVPMMEDNPSESIINNVNGTRIIADLAVKYGVLKFVMVSTDKAVNPTNVMGCSKRICEIYVQSLDKAIKEKQIKGDTQFVTTRFGNVLGSNGSVIPLFRKQIREGGPVTVTHPDIIRFFMLIPEACRLVLEAGTMGKGGEIFVFDMGKPVRIVDLAKRMIMLSEAKNIEIKFTGLRDGEKLYEEVLNDKEITKPTFHPKIKIAKVREYDYEKVCEEIEELISIARKADDMTIVAKMKAIVPEFKSQHSKYEVLDNKEDGLIVSSSPIKR